MHKGTGKAQGASGKLSAKQQAFVEQYLVDLNATGAAIRAGYSAKTAAVIGGENLRKPLIAAAISEARARLSQRTEITQDMVLNELGKIAFSDIRKAVQWFSNVAVAAVDNRDFDAVMEELGEIPEMRHQITNQVEFKSSADIDDATAAAIAEISMTDKGGLKIKFHDKHSALVNIGKHLGMFREKMDVTVKEDLATRLANRRRRAQQRD